MNTCIESMREWLESRPKIKQWLWFIALWCAGLLFTVIATYPIKLIIKSMA